MVGWGLASAVTEKRYFRFASAFFAAVLYHGVWNGLNILTVLAEFSSEQFSLIPFGKFFAGYAPVGLVIMGLGGLGILIKTRSYFQHAIMTQVKQNK
jgi:hypothetical protein